MDLKIINSEISIIESKFMMDYKSKNRLGLKIGYYRNEENTELVRLDKKGELKLVQLISNENKKESN